MTLHVAQHGAGDLAVVFLHGFMGSSADWLPIIEPLEGIDARLVDLPGHGDSAPIVGTDAFETTVDALLDVLPPTFVLVGYSLGGRIALQLALRAPHRVTSLVLESAHPGLQDRAAAADRIILDETRAGALRTTPYRFVFDWSAQPLLASGRDAADAPAQENRRLAHLRARGPEGWAWAVEALSVGRQRALWSQLPALLPPTLVVTGAHDVRYTRVGAALVAQAPDARQMVVTGAGHNVHLEQPTIFVDALGALLSDHRRAPTLRPLRPVSPR